MHSGHDSENPNNITLLLTDRFTVPEWLVSLDVTLEAQVTVVSTSSRQSLKAQQNFQLNGTNATNETEDLVSVHAVLHSDSRGGSQFSWLVSCCTIAMDTLRRSDVHQHFIYLAFPHKY